MATSEAKSGLGKETGCVLVTGGAGFIGSHVVDACVEAGWRVHVIDNLSSGRREDVNVAAVFHEIDLRDERIPALVGEIAPTVIAHLAAQVSVSVSVREPGLDASINLIGLLNLLAGVEPGSLDRFVFSSSGGTVYGEPEQLPATEDLPLDPRTPYGIAKAASEWYIRAASERLGFAYTHLRYANVYGPRQSPHGEAGVVAIFSELLRQGAPCTVHGDGEHIRDYVYVGDVARANLAAIEKGQGESFAVNIGTGLATTTNELYAALARAAGSASDAIHGPARPGDLQANTVDPSLAARLLSWAPSTKLAEGLATTYASFG